MTPRAGHASQTSVSSIPDVRFVVPSEAAGGANRHRPVQDELVMKARLGMADDQQAPPETPPPPPPPGRPPPTPIVWETELTTRSEDPASLRTAALDVVRTVVRGDQSD